MWYGSAGANPFLTDGRRGLCLRLSGPRFTTGIHLMKQFTHNWYLPWCQCTESCYHVSFTQNNIYMPVPGVSTELSGIRSCPESTRYCSQCVIPLNWCQSVFDWWVMAEWLEPWLQQWAARGVSKILGSLVRYWHPPQSSSPTAEAKMWVTNRPSRVQISEPCAPLAPPCGHYSKATS